MKTAVYVCADFHLCLFQAIVRHMCFIFRVACMVLLPIEIPESRTTHKLILMIESSKIFRNRQKRQNI